MKLFEKMIDKLADILVALKIAKDGEDIKPEDYHKYCEIRL